MTNYPYKTILTKANNIKRNVDRNQILGEQTGWSYYIAKAILSPNKAVSKITVKSAPKPTGSHISRQISRADYLDCARRFTRYVESHNQLPNYIVWDNMKISVPMYTYLFADILVYYAISGLFPTKRNVNTKVFTKPTETINGVYSYFVKVFGGFGDTIDGALSKVNSRGYSYYYDDKYSNKESIDRIKKGLGVNCTDACHVFYNIMLELIKKGKYKKVECLHVMCSSGGHVKLRITLNDGSRIIRDPACCISDNGKGYTCNWCTDTPIAIDPDWFLENLYR